MPREFVEQALARCSVDGSKFWFSCNPEHPSHWFYNEWIKKLEEKKAYYIHFKMMDNPSLSQAVLDRYKELYSGVFYERFVLGKWTSAYGAVYPMFSKALHISSSIPDNLEGFIVSCDYGTTNPTTFGLWGFSPSDNKWYRIREYYHCSRLTGVIKTDTEYYSDLVRFLGDTTPTVIVVDPSAASFIQCIKSKGEFRVIPAKNDVNSGIQAVSKMLHECSLSVNEAVKTSLENLSFTAGI